MNLYAQQMIDMANRIGKPQVAKTTTVGTPGQQGIDIGSILMALSMSGLFNKKSPAYSATPANESLPFFGLDIPAATSPDTGLLPLPPGRDLESLIGSAPSSVMNNLPYQNASAMTPDVLLRLLGIIR